MKVATELEIYLLKEKKGYSNIWPNQTIVSDQSELTILLCQPMIIYVGY